MSTRRLRYKGFSVALQVPDAVPAALRKLRSGTGSEPEGPKGSLKVCDAPPVSAAWRDPSGASAFLSNFYGGHGGQAPDSEVLSRMSLKDQVASTNWYHTIDLPGGVVTPGTFDHRPLVPHYGIPESLEGMRCLDAACSNGFWTFEFERRGGTVVALDIPSLGELDFPAGTPPMAAATSGGLDQLSARAFHIAHRALGSQAKLVRSNLYAMNPQDLGTFDFVHMADVLLHLQNPLAALRRLRELTAPGGSALIAEVFDPSLVGQVTHYLGGFEGLVWWEPSLDCLVQMVYDAGFTSVDVLRIYRSPVRGHWRAVLRAVS